MAWRKSGMAAVASRGNSGKASWQWQWRRRRIENKWRKLAACMAKEKQRLALAKIGGSAIESGISVSQREGKSANMA